MSRPHLRVVSDAQAELLGLRAEALRRLARRYPNAESRRTMRGSLERLVRTFTNGQRTVETFEWELLADEDLSGQVWSAVAERFSRATALKDASFLREMLHQCQRVGLLSHEEAAAACAFPTRQQGRQGRTPRSALTPEDVHRLVQAASTAQGSSPAVRTRDAALLLTLASTGARRSELAQVRTRDVHLEERRIWLATTKSGVPRNAWLHPNSVQALQHWIDLLGEDRTALFPRLSRTGRPLDDQPMSDHQVWKIVRRRADEAGLADVAPHDLRRFVVSTLLDQTHDLALVARVVGHQQVTTTARYDRRPEDRSRAAVETLPLPSLRALRHSA